MRVTFAYLDGVVAVRSGFQDPFSSVVTDLPLGLGCLRSYAARDPEIGGRLTMANRGFAPGAGVKEVVNSLAATRPDVVAFSCFVWNRESVHKAARSLRRRLPKVKLVVGGPEVPWAPSGLADYLDKRPYLDVAVPGEAEETFTELLRAWLRGRPADGVAGLACRKDGEVVTTPPRPFLDDMDRVPSPYLSGAVAVGGEYGLVSLETSRGCPLTCAFCDYHVGRHSVRDFSLARLQAELDFLSGKGFRGTVFIIDPLLNVKKDRFKKALDILKTWPHPLRFVLHPEMFDDEAIAKVGALAAPALAIGIQSTNPAAMKNIDRRFHLDRITATIGRLLRFPNVSVILDLIIGLPGDDYEGFKRTLDWALSFPRPPFVSAFDLWMSPNAPLYGRAGTFGIQYDGQGTVERTASFPSEEIMKATWLNAALAEVQASDALREKFERLRRGGQRPSDALEKLASVLQDLGRLSRERVRVY